MQPGIPESVRPRIQHLRRLLLIHSCIYYELNRNAVSDAQWDAWAKELLQLQTRHPEHLLNGVYDAAFLGWEGHTGFGLPRDEWVMGKADRVLRLCAQYDPSTI